MAPGIKTNLVLLTKRNFHARQLVAAVDELFTRHESGTSGVLRLTITTERMRMRAVVHIGSRIVRGYFCVIHPA